MSFIHRRFALFSRGLAFPKDLLCRVFPKEPPATQGLQFVRTLSPVRDALSLPRPGEGRDWDRGPLSTDTRGPGGFELRETGEGSKEEGPVWGLTLGVGKQGGLGAEKGVRQGGRPPRVTHSSTGHPDPEPRPHARHCRGHGDVRTRGRGLGGVLLVRVKHSQCAGNTANACLTTVTSPHGGLLSSELTAPESPQYML